MLSPINLAVRTPGYSPLHVRRWNTDSLRINSACSMTILWRRAILTKSLSILVKVGNMKEKYDSRQLLKHMPHEFLELYDQLTCLDYYKKPNYRVGVLFSLLLPASGQTFSSLGNTESVWRDQGTKKYQRHWSVRLGKRIRRRLYHDNYYLDSTPWRQTNSWSCRVGVLLLWRQK